MTSQLLLTHSSFNNNATFSIADVILSIRIDILFAVTILASRVSHPTQHDRADLIRLLTYLSHTPKKSILLKCDNENPTLSVYADASYGIHDIRPYRI